MVNLAVLILPLCSQVFTAVHTQSVNTSSDNTTAGSPVASGLRGDDEEEFWTTWFDVDDPYNSPGDFETVTAITSSLGEDICPRTHYISEAECRLVAADDNSVADVLRRKCTTDGLICLNQDQTNRSCNDYKVRFLCTERDDDGGEGTSGRRRATSFDMRIYIILAAVPIVIFGLRIFWSCTVERRRRRQRRRLRAIRQRHPENSIDPEVFMPPPSYQDLFGNEGPFSLSRRYTLCRKCQSSQCVIFRTRLTRISELRERSASEPGVAGSVNSDESSVQVNTDSPEGGSRTVSTSSSDETASVDSGQTSNTSCSSSDSDEQSQTVEQNINSITVETSQCECPCHKNRAEVMSYDNPAYSPDVEFHSGRPRLPGMHLSVFSLFRSPSETSLSEPPPPTYKEALKILKKNQKGESKTSCCCDDIEH